MLRRRAAVPNASSEGLEEVLVQLVQRHGDFRLHAHPMAEHEFCEPPSVDEFDARVDAVRFGSGACGEAARGDEDTAVALRAHERPDESLDRRTLDGLVRAIPLGLQVDAVEAERILTDDPIDARITAASQVFNAPEAA